MSAFRSLPWPIQLAAVALVAAIGIALIVMALEPRGRRTAQRQRHRAQAERRDLRRSKRGTSPDTGSQDGDMRRHDDADADKPPYQPPTPGLPPTAGMRAISKLPGQDRLTRDDQREQHVQSDATPAAAEDHLSGATPRLERVDPALAADEPPPLRGSGPAPEHPATAQMPLVRPPVPRPLPPPPSGETRAQRRIRLEALIEAEAAERRRPERPQDGRQGP